MPQLDYPVQTWIISSIWKIVEVESQTFCIIQFRFKVQSLRASCHCLVVFLILNLSIFIDNLILKYCGEGVKIGGRSKLTPLLEAWVLKFQLQPVLVVNLSTLSHCDAHMYFDTYRSWSIWTTCWMESFPNCRYDSHTQSSMDVL